MKVYAVTPRKFPHAIGTDEGHDIVIYPSETNPDKAYRVDVTHGRCNCPAWTFQKTGGGRRFPCKHLRALGFVERIEAEQKKAAQKQIKLKVSANIPAYPINESAGKKAAWTRKYGKLTQKEAA